MLLARLNRHLGLVVTLACGLTIATALYAALTTPLDPDIATARGLGGRLVVSAVAFNGPAEVDGVAPGDFLTRQAGHGAALAWVFRTPGGARLVLAAPPLTSLTLFLVALGWSLLFLGLIVLARSPDRPAAMAFWRLSLLLAATLGLYPAAEHGLPWVLVLHFIVLRLCGPALLELALVFPAGTHPRARRPLVRFLLWLPALTVLPLYQISTTGAHREMAWLPELVLAAYVAGAAVRLLWICLHPGILVQRAQLYYLAVGLLGALAPPMLLTLAPQLLAGRPLVPADVTLLALGALPLCVGLAIARAGLFGIALRRRTLWLLRRVMLPTAVAGVAGLCTLAVQESWRPLLPFLDAGGAAVVALLYYARRPLPARPRLQPAPARALAVDGRLLLAEPTVVGGAPNEGGNQPLPMSGLLSLREIEALTCAAQGLRTPQIAERLQVSERTVGTYFARIFAKLDVHTRAQAVHVAQQRGILPED